MVAALDNLIQTLRQIKKDMPALIAEVLLENKELIEDMNIAQLKEGKRSDGSSLPDYSPVSVAKFGKQPGPMTLEKTGRFHRGIFLKVYAAQSFAELIGTDPKTGKLEALYDLTIIGVNDENLEVIKFDILLPGLQVKIQERYFS